jgi:2-polyprenyl-3-methyl-5-hydroxy-6-metoxy-1,4-benzoquinol methylase
LAAARHARLEEVPQALGSGGGLRAGGVEAQEIVGVVYSPLSRAWSLSKSDLDVNYMLYGTRTA